MIFWVKITQENIGLLIDPDIIWNDKNSYEPCTKEYVYLNCYSNIVYRVFIYKGVDAIVKDENNFHPTHFAPLIF